MAMVPRWANVAGTLCPFLWHSDSTVKLVFPSYRERLADRSVNATILQDELTEVFKICK